MIRIAGPLHAAEPSGADLEQSLYALDATTIDLCLSLFPWARFRQGKAAVKMHTLLDLCGNIPTLIYISDGKLHEVNVLDEIVPEPGAFYLMDRGYLDFDRLYRFSVEGAFFVLRNKSNIVLRRRYSRPIDRDCGVLCEQAVVLDTLQSASHYPEALRRVRFRNAATGQRLEFLTNNVALPVLTIVHIYKCRWQIELFFKWIMQRLRIKAFYGTSENAVKTQIWIAVSVYVLVAIVRKRLALEASLYTFLQVLSLSLFEKMPILQSFQDIDSHDDLSNSANQLILFDF